MGGGAGPARSPAHWCAARQWRHRPPARRAPRRPFFPRISSLIAFRFRPRCRRRREDSSICGANIGERAQTSAREDERDETPTKIQNKNKTIALVLIDAPFFFRRLCLLERDTVLFVGVRPGGPAAATNTPENTRARAAPLFRAARTGERRRGGAIRTHPNGQNPRRAPIGARVR